MEAENPFGLVLKSLGWQEIKMATWEKLYVLCSAIQWRVAKQQTIVKRQWQTLLGCDQWGLDGSHEPKMVWFCNLVGMGTGHLAIKIRHLHDVSAPAVPPS